ncbi:MAG: serine/threonine protein kinase, partial [Myxococcales bacterium]|nr:serine/threonine protein kinase [Myxococcales bacterium]
LKPENVFLVERRGVTVAKLLDFGVSKMVEDQTMSITVTGVVVGTPYYLSPEQARGERDIDHRVDLWSMGVLLYECLTGVLPFNADNYEQLLRKILGSRPLPPSRFQARINPAVERAVMRALSADRDERPGSAREMLDLMRQARDAIRRSRRPPRALGAPADFGETLPDSSAGLRSPTVTIEDFDYTIPEDPTEVSDSFIGDEIRVLINGATKTED